MCIIFFGHFNSYNIYLGDQCFLKKNDYFFFPQYKLYGEPMILACIEAGTHHIDLSGEFEVSMTNNFYLKKNLDFFSAFSIYCTFKILILF